MGRPKVIGETLRPVNVSTGGVHPSVQATMKQRLSENVTPKDRSQAIKGLKRGTPAMGKTPRG